MDYTSNSNKDKAAAAQQAEPKKIEQIVTGKVVVKKKGVASRFKSVFFNGDAKSTAAFVAADVILPAMRDLAFAAWQESGRSMVFGQGRGRTAPPEMRGNIRYDNVTKLRPDSVRLPGQPPRSLNRAVQKASSDFLFVDRKDAEDALEEMINTVDKYNVVSLSDLNQICGRPSATVDQKWGWTRLTQANVRQVREGFLLELPPMEEI